ncbi:GfdT protein [Maritimibacter sp. 55A14]|uniref:FIST N-terminal domain-containing protein n=1 Tax=Maritimibacter sp. 55A14 TaxID=2174844 RepID=UPI000D60A6F9|nr:FIST N-terminal domain-containing protein [Maritimibacter sp. 55A14]PWE32550.1 GfdT protein [Maritimibacter sp. 55A14]
MEGIASPSADAGAILRRAQVRHDAPDPIAAIRAEMGDTALSLVLFFVTPEADFEPLMVEAAQRFPGAHCVGCTTAGEIGEDGYTSGEIVAIGFAADHFHAIVQVIENLRDFTPHTFVSQSVRARARLAGEASDWPNEFAFLAVDGLSMKEDELVAALAAGLGPMPLFGGSAADGERYAETLIACDGAVLRNAAVVCMLRTDCPVRVFRLDHFHPTERRMVVTEADPARRVVRRINAEVAAQEYARILGKPPEGLAASTFAANPVVVRIGGQHHVRAIQKVEENGDLRFFSAIDEGLVLTLAESEDMTAHLEAELGQLSVDQPPLAILACDCILRRTEVNQKQIGRQVSRILAAHGVLGFSTYGEQINGLHVNQTMTGVAIYRPDGGEP